MSLHPEDPSTRIQGVYPIIATTPNKETLSVLHVGTLGPFDFSVEEVVAQKTMF